MRSRISLLAFGASTLLFATTASADPGDYDPAYEQISGYGAGTLDERVARLEKRLSSESMMEMLNRIDQLQSDVLRLRGELEELHHALEMVKQQQGAMYADLEQRLQGARAAVPENPPPADEAATQPPAAEPPPPSRAPSSPIATADAGSVKQAAYQKGLNLLKDGKYPEAIREFKSFLAANPAGENADNALYWMGEAYYVLRDFTAAREAYRKLVREYPQSSRLADAQLKLGYIEYDTAQWAKAREQLNEVVKRYPGSNAAAQAAKKLAKMKQEGH